MIHIYMENIQTLINNRALTAKQKKAVYVFRDTDPTITPFGNLWVTRDQTHRILISKDGQIMDKRKL